MARIVLGIGSSHTPILAIPVEQWMHRAAADQANPKLNLSDGRVVTYGELLADVGDVYAGEASIEVLTRKSEICQAALDHLADELAAADPDVVIIIGDDQEELFDSSNQPAIAVFYGSDVVTSSKYGVEGAPEWVRITGRGYMMDQSHVLAGAPAFGLHVIQGLLDRNVDVATLSHVDSPGPAAGFGHAFGFIVKRLFKSRQIPLLPILLNTYYPPNVLSSARCFDIGSALRGAIEASPDDLKVAIIASGGLSHFVVDESLDQRVLEGFTPGKSELLRSIERPALNSGSSEILNWVLAAGALSDLPVTWSEYQPIYRTPAGTGVGVAFVVWGGQPAKEGTN